MAADDTFRSAREWRGIRFSEESIAQLDNGRVAASVARIDVQRITLREGTVRERPILQIGAGVAIILIAIIPICQFIGFLSHGILWSGIIWLLLAVGVGVLIIRNALKRGHFLDIETTAGHRKLAVEGHPSPSEIDSFLKSFEDRFGYQIERTPPNVP